jgi:hypothetical protein
MVLSIADHPVLGIAARHLVQLGKMPDSFYSDGDLGVISRYYKIPRGPEDLAEKRKEDT